MMGKMRAWVVADWGQAPALAEIATPSPRAGEVLVKVRAAALNFADLLMIDGRYQDRPALPVTLGMELAGEVVAVGDGVTAPAIGTRVAAYTGHGALAEFAVVPAAACVALPDTMPFDHAAAFLVAYGTSHLALTRVARLQAGETLLVTGAAGGVGLTAVQVGKRLGARVIATARGDSRQAVAKAAGADEVLDSEAPDLKAQLRALGGLDVGYEVLGGASFDAALGAMRPEGRLLTIGFASGTVPQVPANHLLVKNVSVIGFWLGGYAKFAPHRVAESVAELFRWYAAGDLHPHISAHLSMEELPEGLALLRDRKATGKVVVQLG